MSDWHDVLIPPKDPGQPRPVFFFPMNILYLCWPSFMPSYNFYECMTTAVYCFFLYPKDAIIQLKPAPGSRPFFIWDEGVSGREPDLRQRVAVTNCIINSFFPPKHRGESRQFENESAGRISPGPSNGWDESRLLSIQAGVKVAEIYKLECGLGYLGSSADISKKWLYVGTILLFITFILLLYGGMCWCIHGEERKTFFDCSLEIKLHQYICIFSDFGSCQIKAAKKSLIKNTYQLSL